MFGRKQPSHKDQTAEQAESKGRTLLDRVNSGAGQFARMAVFALIAEVYTLAAAAWICAVLYAISFVLARDKPVEQRNPYAPYLAIFFLVIGCVGFAFTRGWNIMVWQAAH
jgi:hypothetical protein